jgi:hypothetical protein
MMNTRNPPHRSCHGSRLPLCQRQRIGAMTDPDKTYDLPGALCTAGGADVEPINRQSRKTPK